MSQLPSWQYARRVCVDLETYDPSLKELGPGPRRNGYTCGIAFAIEDGPDAYLPIRHAEDNLPVDQVFRYLQDQAKDFRGEIVGTNLSYDLDFLQEEGVWFGEATFRDVQIAEPLIDELRTSYALRALAEHYELPGKDEQILRAAAQEYGVDPKTGMNALPGRFVAPYGLQDVRLPLKIYEKQRPLLAQQNLDNIFNLECQLQPVLVKMRARGVRIDLDALQRVEDWARDQEIEALQRVKVLTGVTVPLGGVWQATIMAQVLQAIGFKVGKTRTGKPNIDKFVLDSIDHPAAEAAAWARKVNKLRTTFAASIRDHIVGDRIHCVFNQLARENDDDSGIKGARYGRLSSEHPNLQQQPSKDEFASRWRSIYVPDGEGTLWASPDYSQQEPRMVTHFAVKAGCSRAREMAQRYRTDPKVDNHQAMADLTGLERKYAKIIYLGLCYGMGGAKLADSLGLPTQIIETRDKRLIRVAGEDAQKILDQFHAEAPFIKELADKCKAKAAQRGYITTILGRRCHFPKDGEGNYDWTHKALNRLIQGSSADQTKKAMVMADAAGFGLQMQVHDELGLTVADRAAAEGVAEIMRTCVPLEVPSRVDVEVGASWGEIK